MDANEWFEEQDYYTGVEIYARSAGAKRRVVDSLRKTKNNRNISVLVRELRKLKTTPVVVKTKPAAPKPPAKKETPTQTRLEREHEKTASANETFQKIRYGELPPELKLRFRKLKDLFYDMCDLKFALNDLPDTEEEAALQLQLQIEQLDDQKDGIWKELDHWQLYKTMLPTKTEEDFSSWDTKALFLKRASLTSSIHKMKKRIAGWKKNLEKETDKRAARKIEQQISRTKKNMHTNELNLRKIEQRL